MIFERKPQRVEAFQLTRETLADFGAWPAWLKEAYVKMDRGERVPGSVWPSTRGPEVMLLASDGECHVVPVGAYIIKTDEGLTAMPQISFAEEYQPVMPADEEDEFDDAMRIEMQAWIDVIAVLASDVSPNAKQWARFFAPQEFMFEGKPLSEDELHAIFAGAPEVMAHMLHCVGHERFGDRWVEYWSEIDPAFMDDDS